MNRRAPLRAALLLSCLLPCGFAGSVPDIATATAATPAVGAPQKVLRYSFRVAETGFDPAQITDLYSRTIAAAIFDAPLQYEIGRASCRERV